MKKLLLILSLIIISFHCFSQDRIIRKDGRTIECEVLSVDSTYVNFKLLHGSTYIETRLEMDQVEDIQYEGYYDPRTIEPDIILVKKEGVSYKYYIGNRSLSNSELSGLLSLNQLAYAKYKKAQASNGGAMVFGFIGGALIGWPIGTAIGGGNPNWYLAAAGGGFILLSIPFSLDARENLHSAIDIYNEGLNKTSYVKPKVFLGFSQNGVGIRLVF